MSIASLFIFANPANADDTSTTVVPTVPVAVAPGFDVGTTIIGQSDKSTSSVRVVDPSTKSAPEVVPSTTVTRPSVQATTPVVVTPRPKSDTGTDNTVVRPVVQAPQIGADTNASSAPVEVTRVTPQVVTEAPASTTEAPSTTSSSTVDPAPAQQLTGPTTYGGGPQPVWGFLGYGALGAFVAMFAYRANARRSGSAS